MAHVYVVRHAMVEINPDVVPEKWNLSEAGRQSTAELAARESWDDVAVIWHSPEPKAEQTARIIAESASIELKMHPALRELEMNAGFLPQDEFKRRVGAYLEGYPDPAFEDYAAATDRIVQAVQEIAEQMEGRSFVIVSHGRIICAFYAHLLGRRVTVEEWKSIGFPDLSVVDLNTSRIERGFLSQRRT